MTPNDGGPAFPHDIIHKFSDGTFEVRERSGMSLRDWFAGQALTGLCARDLEGNSLGNNHINHAYVRGFCDSRLVRDAYTLADAMLAERVKKDTP